MMERGPGGEVQDKGFLFPPDVVFDEDKLLALLSGRPEVRRLKGVFRTPNGWVAVNRTSSGTSVKPTAYRRDSRLEVFATGVADDWAGFTAALNGCVAG
jgi:hypothetical protein